MDHIAIDLGGRESQICTRNAGGEIVDERRWLTGELERYLARREPSHVIVETCAEAFRVADIALELGHQAVVVPATLVKSLGVGARGVKTDVRDARATSLASCRIDLPSVHIPSAWAREVKSMCGMREALVQARTKLINTVRGWMRGQVIRIRSGASRTFPERVRTAAMSREIELPRFVVRQLETLETLNAQIGEADKEVREYAKNNEVCRRLMTVPGVGPVTALRFVAALDTVERFTSAHSVQSYVGLTPGEHSSSKLKRRTSITKAGSPELRWALVQAAWAARRTRNNGVDPMVVWSRGVEERRGKRIATVALARKIAGVMFAVWRDGTTYDPARMREHQH
jgi:transposase